MYLSKSEGRKYYFGIINFLCTLEKKRYITLVITKTFGTFQ